MNQANGMLGKHAIVIGGSIGGLLTARVLRNFFAKVTIVERDSFSENYEPRKACPGKKCPRDLWRRYSGDQSAVSRILRYSRVNRFRRLRFLQRPVLVPWRRLEGASQTGLNLVLAKSAIFRVEFAPTVAKRYRHPDSRKMFRRWPDRECGQLSYHRRRNSPL